MLKFYFLIIIHGTLVRIFKRGNYGQLKAWFSWTFNLKKHKNWNHDQPWGAPVDPRKLLLGPPRLKCPIEWTVQMRVVQSGGWYPPTPTPPNGGFFLADRVFSPPLPPPAFLLCRDHRRPSPPLEMGHRFLAKSVPFLAASSHLSCYRLPAWTRPSALLVRGFLETRCLIWTRLIDVELYWPGLLHRLAMHLMEIWC